MVKKKKRTIKDAVDELNSEEVECPFGDLTEDIPVKKRKRARTLTDQDTGDEMVITLSGSMPKKEAIRRAKLEQEMFDENFPIRKKKKKKKKKSSREVILMPEKTNSDAPKKSKLNAPTSEILKMQGKLDNLVKVPKELLDTFMTVFGNSSKDIAEEFLKSIAPVFLSYEDAMNYSTVALRDGLSYDSEIDLELAPLLEWAARLNTFEIFLSKLTSLSEDTKKRLVRLATIKAVEKSFLQKGSSIANLSAHNKVAGIVTTLDNQSAAQKVKKSAELVTRLKNASTKVKESTSRMPGAIIKKRKA